MDSITQDMRYRLSLIEYSLKHGVTKAAIKYRTNRQYIYRWRKRYDGTIESLRDRSRRPHSHPNQHTPEEIKLITDMRRRNPHDGLVVFWVKLRQRDIQDRYPASIDCFVNALLWLRSHQTRSTSQSLTNRCNTRVKESRSM